MGRGEMIYPEVGRRSPAAGAHIFCGRTNIFFVTVNAKDRVPWMADAAAQDSLTQLWREEANAWLIGYFLLMPDHLHFFCAPRDLHFGIDQWIEFWKRQFTRRHQDRSWAWQRKSFHHRIRNRKEYEEKLAYVRENPLRKKLVANPDNWPYQGRVYDLKWAWD
jgi:putative transposase